MADYHQLVARIEQLLLRHQELEKKYAAVCRQLHSTQGQCDNLRNKMKQAQIRIREALNNLPEPLTSPDLTTSHSAAHHEPY